MAATKKKQTFFRNCALETCPVMFETTNAKKIYCSILCRNRAGSLRSKRKRIAHFKEMRSDAAIWAHLNKHIGFAVEQSILSQYERHDRCYIAFAIWELRLTGFKIPNMMIGYYAEKMKEKLPTKIADLIKIRKPRGVKDGL